MQILGEFFTARAGRLFDGEVAVLTEIAFPGRALDRDEVTAARKPTTIMLRKGFGPETTFHMSPLFNVLWLNASGKVVRYVVTFPPEAEQAAAQRWPSKK